MNDIRALLLDANGFGWRAVAGDTVFRGMLRLRPERLPAAISSNRLMKRLLQDRYSALGYIADWRDAFVEHPALSVRVCNTCDLVEFYECIRNLREYDIIIVLHSATGDSIALLSWFASAFDRRRAPLVVFFGNEYSILGEKLAFLKQTGAEFLCSQLPEAAAQWLYGDKGKSKLILAPHALNPRVYKPDASIVRSIDVGFAGVLYHNIIGDMERTNLVEYFKSGKGHSMPLQRDLRCQTMPRDKWVKFLQMCKGVVGAESGTYYMDALGSAASKAIGCVKSNPDATFSEVFEKCFAELEVYVNAKAISSRHFEPIGTKTCQILVEGHYNGILKGGEHFLSVKRDMSNIDEVIKKFCDEGERLAIAEKAYAYVLSQHTHKHRVTHILREVGMIGRTA